MKGRYTHYILMPNTDSAKAKQVSTRYDWKTFTYKEVEKTGKKTQDVTLPTEDDLKSDIEAFMSKHSISGSGTKAELIDDIHNHCRDNGTPTEEVEYKYIVEEVDKTTDHSAKILDMLKRHPHYFAPRVSLDGTEMVFKSDFTLAELKAIEGLSGFSVYTNEELKAYFSSSNKWKEDEA